MQSLSTLEQEIKVCTKCRLSTGRTNAVPGTGSHQATILFIGEGPGKEEDFQGKPFVGRSGKLLTACLDKIGIKREDVFITNIVKCRPPENRDPLEDEVEICWAYLEAQIKCLDPKIIVTLGRHSMHRFLPGATISTVHGEPKRCKSDGRIIYPMYHPAVALYKASSLNILEKDFFRLKSMLDKIQSGAIKHMAKNTTVEMENIELSNNIPMNLTPLKIKQTPENLKLF